MNPLENELRFAERVNEFAVKALGAKARVEAFHVAVLPGAAGIDLERANGVIFQPTLDHFSHELRSVATADVSGGAMHLYRLFQYIKHVCGLDLAGRVDGVALARILIDEVEHFSTCPRAACSR